MSGPKDLKSSDFIELDRRFTPLTQKDGPEDIALLSYTRRLLGREAGLGWKDLLLRRLVVVLGEPGSGKTWEFRHRAESLQTRNQYSFFIRLDELVNQSLDIVLGPEDNRRFRKWLRSNLDGTLYLDSVDEAKFHKVSEFYVSLKRLRDGIGTEGLKRTRLFLSSRISEWQPETDAQELLRCFPLCQPASVASDDSRNQNGSAPRQDLLVVQLEPLDRTRVERFAQARGIQSADAFLKELDENHAWEFARRPVDVNDLLNHWITRKRLGSLTELLEHNIESNLCPSERDKDDPLSPNKAREGAQALAAGIIFCRQFSFKVPDLAFVTEALEASECLPNDWKADQCRALLTRPLFDAQSYGRIRFHHRRITEYLAAKWLEARVQQGCPINEIEELLFERTADVRVLRDALSPIAAWLCCGGETWNGNIRNWILEVAPEIQLQYGDPSCLPINYKRAILRALIRRYEGRDRIWIESSPESLSRLADPAIADDISEIILNSAVSVDLRTEMIHVVRHGHLHACLDPLLVLILSQSEPDNLKTSAAAAIRDAGTTKSRRKLAEIASRFPKISNHLCARICEALYPAVIDAHDLIDLLRKTEPVPEYSVDLPFYLASHFADVLRPEDSGELASLFVELGQTPPHVIHAGEETNVSSKFYWVGQVIPTILLKLFAQSRLSDAENRSAASALWFLSHIHRCSNFHDDKLKELAKATERFPSVRRSYFWIVVDEWRRNHKDDPVYLGQLFDYHTVVKPIPEDLQWLVDDIKMQEDPRNRRLALKSTMDLSGPSGLRGCDRRRIRAAIASNSSLLSAYRQLRGRTRMPRVKRFWFTYFENRLGSHWWWEDRLHSLRRRWTSLRDQWSLFRHINWLVTGKAVGWLCNLAHEADESSRYDKWTPLTWDGLRKKRGRLIAWAAKRGCKRTWREFTPQLPHEMTNPSSVDPRVIVGLAGIQAEVSDGEMNFANLPPKEAEIAVRYAVHELNDLPSWFHDLAEHHQGAVRSVLADCLRGEWNFENTRERTFGVMNILLWQEEMLGSLMELTVLELLKTADPLNVSMLRAALMLINKADTERADQHSAQASKGISFRPCRFHLMADGMVAARRRAGSPIFDRYTQSRFGPE